MISMLVEYLSIFYQTGDTAQLAVIARSLLAVIPDDLVALQFLGMALYQMGRVDDAYRIFQRVNAEQECGGTPDGTSVCEPASSVSYREATCVNSGLADAWRQVSELLDRFGFRKSAERAYAAAIAATGVHSK